MALAVPLWILAVVREVIHLPLAFRRQVGVLVHLVQIVQLAPPTVAMVVLAVVRAHTMGLALELEMKEGIHLPREIMVRQKVVLMLAVAVVAHLLVVLQEMVETEQHHQFLGQALLTQVAVALVLVLESLALAALVGVAMEQLPLILTEVLAQLTAAVAVVVELTSHLREVLAALAALA